MDILNNTLPVAPIKNELAAAYRLQGAVRRQQARDYGRRIRALWPHLDELRTKYIDSDVQIQAGRVSEFYSDESLCARESLRTHPAVLAALHDAWLACSAVNEAGGLEAGRGLDKANFRSMARRVYLVSVLASEREPEVTTCNRALERDWQADVGGRSTLSRDAFFASWFQLADLHTRSVSPAAYAAWIRGVTARIVEQGEEQQQARWRDCDQIVIEQTGVARRSRSCSSAAASASSGATNGAGDAAGRRRARSEGSSASTSASVTATPRAGWRLQHWLAAFKAEAEREVERGVAAPPAVAPPLARKRRLSQARLVPIQSPRRPPPPESTAAAAATAAVAAQRPRRNSLAPLASAAAAAPAAQRTPVPPQAATGDVTMPSPLKEKRRAKLRSPTAKPPPSSPPPPQTLNHPSPPPVAAALPQRPPKLLARESSSARAIAKARVAQRWRAAVRTIGACNQLLRSSCRSAGSASDRAEFTGVALGAEGDGDVNESVFS